MVDMLIGAPSHDPNLLNHLKLRPVPSRHPGSWRGRCDCQPPDADGGPPDFIRAT